PTRLALELPLAAAVTSWDLILVDGPAGYADSCPGRMKSLYTAAALARRKPGADVIVHDCDRPLEQAYCERFFHPLELVRELDRLRHYRNAAPSLTRNVAGL
ncbi:MAG TPA: hypothetical protein VHN15_13405, partial [Thermoanaerobaculia bacterium]|nr:hypothetical protein [Thermoanaerobaculia bacterium]